MYSIMSEKEFRYSVGFVLLGFALIGLLLISYPKTEQSLGAAPSGLYSTISSSSVIGISTTSPITLFTTTLNCTSRIIGTTDQIIRISFSSTTPSSSTGHIQAASTTVAYDAGIYGCGQWRAIGLESQTDSATSTILTEEFR